MIILRKMVMVMEVINQLNLVLSKKEKRRFMKMVTIINVERGKVFCKFVIFIEILLSFINVFFNYSSYLYDFKLNNYSYDFKLNNYIIMYLIIIFINVLYLQFLKKASISSRNYNTINVITTSYVTFTMVWGSVIALMDQAISGQIFIYIINLVACSTIYYMDNRKWLISYFTSASVLFFGLPFFQQSKNIIWGNYINIIAVSVCLYFCSRILYKNLYNDLKNRMSIIETSKKLKNDLEEKERVYNKLEKSNKMLKELSVTDEITNISNRRGLKEYMNSLVIDIPYKEKPVSAIMIDIDKFKLYNDKYGNGKGDEALKKISQELIKTIRDPRDFVARYGGKEFVYIALGTDRAEINKIANEIRERIYNLKIVNEYSSALNYLTVSVGTATVILCNNNSIKESIEKANKMLFKTKLL